MMMPPIGGVLLIACSLPAATYHVDALGLGGNPSDSNPGTAEKPWKSAMKAFTSASPGDMVIFRKGLYRMPRTLLTADLRLDPAEGRPFVFKALPGEEVIITVMKPVKAGDWKRIGSTRAGQPIYAAPSGEDGRVVNLTEDGVPLARPFTSDPKLPHGDSLPEVISRPGEWAASLRDHRVMVCTTDGNPPGNRIEVCDVRGGNGGANLIDLQRDPANRCRNLRVVFENLILEGGNFGLTIRTGSVELRRCVLRKSFSDLVNTQSGRLSAVDCDFSAFGESAIDVTGPGDSPLPPGTAPMCIRRCQFHHNAAVRGLAPKVKGYNAVMLKGGCSDILVEECEFHHLRITICALALGDDTAGVSTREGLRLTARGNHFHHITGPAPVVAFEDTEDCRFVGNRITDCDVDGLIAFEGAPKDNVRVESRDNLLRNNRVKGVAVKDSP